MSYSAAIITVDSRILSGERTDSASPAISALLKEKGFDPIYKSLVDNDAAAIASELKRCAEEIGAALIITLGGTGFAPQDVTPEATLSVLERETHGIAEAMRAGGMKHSDRACLSRGVAGIMRGGSLVLNLPGNERAAEENISAVIEPLRHAAAMLAKFKAEPLKNEKKQAPSADAWLREAKASPEAGQCGMFLIHNGTVRSTAKAKVRGGEDSKPVRGMLFSYDSAKAEAAVKTAYSLPGIYYVRVWLNEGRLDPGDDIMLVLIGGDIRPHVVAALDALVGELKENCVSETEIY